VWGASNADLRDRRRYSRVRRARLAPLVDEWFADDGATVKDRLSAAVPKLSKKDIREAAAMVLERSAALQHDAPVGE
jgi:hypothetical protein